MEFVLNYFNRKIAVFWYLYRYQTPAARAMIDVMRKLAPNFEAIK